MCSRRSCLTFLASLVRCTEVLNMWGISAFRGVQGANFELMPHTRATLDTASPDEVRSVSARDLLFDPCSHSSAP